MQVAYENVNSRLRELWLQNASNVPLTNALLLRICTRIRESLRAEAEAVISGSLSRNRRPWRRELVFNFEIRWSRYFVREAELLIRLREMSNTECQKFALEDSLFPIPRELGFGINENMNEKLNRELWRAWHAKKRGVKLADIGQWSSKSKKPVDNAAGQSSHEPTKSSR